MIDTSSFQYKENRTQDLYVFLKNKGFEVYFPGVKSGECTNPYLVVKKSTATKSNSFSSNEELYSVLCYVPKMKYSTLETYVSSMKKAMLDIKPLFKERGQETPSYYDDNLKAHMISVDYTNYKKL